MAYFQPFKKSTGAKTPGFIAAEIGQYESELAEKQRIQEIKSQNLLGAGSTYKTVTGKMEKDPIAEGLRMGWDKMTGPSAEVAAMGSAAPETAGLTNATMVGEGGMAAGSAAPAAEMSMMGLEGTGALSAELAAGAEAAGALGTTAGTAAGTGAATAGAGAAGAGAAGAGAAGAGAAGAGGMAALGPVGIGLAGAYLLSQLLG